MQWPIEDYKMAKDKTAELESVVDVEMLDRIKALEERAFQANQKILFAESKIDKILGDIKLIFSKLDFDDERIKTQRQALVDHKIMPGVSTEAAVSPREDTITVMGKTVTVRR